MNDQMTIFPLVLNDSQKRILSDLHFDILDYDTSSLVGAVRYPFLNMSYISYLAGNCSVRLANMLESLRQHNAKTACVHLITAFNAAYELHLHLLDLLGKYTDDQCISDYDVYVVGIVDTIHRIFFESYTFYFTEIVSK